MRRKVIMPSLALCVLLGSVCWAQSGSLAVQQSSQVWQRLRRQYLSLRTLSGTFEQTICSEVDGTCRNFAGGFAFRLPGQFRLEVTEPVRQVIVGSDSGVWFYFPEERRAVYQAAGSSIPLLAFLAPVLDSTSTVELDVDATGTPIMRITAGDTYSLANLVLELSSSRDRIVGFAFDDEYGNHHHFRLSRQRWNPRLSPKTFRFVPPAGTVVERQ